jgi:hypothetical protein
VVGVPEQLVGRRREVAFHPSCEWGVLVAFYKAVLDILDA